MADSIVSARPIARSYPYKVKITVTDDSDQVVFPEGCTLAADFREYVGAPAALTTATTGNGKLTRVDDDTIMLTLDRDDTKAMEGSVVTDIVRTDLAPDEWLGIQLKIPVAAVATVTVE